MGKKLVVLTTAAGIAIGAGATLLTPNGAQVSVDHAVVGGAKSVHSMRIVNDDSNPGRKIVEARNEFVVEGIGVKFSGQDSHFLDEDPELEQLVEPMLSGSQLMLSAHCERIEAGPCPLREIYVQRNDGGFDVNAAGAGQQVVYQPVGKRAEALEALSSVVYTRMCARDGGFCP